MAGGTVVRAFWTQCPQRLARASPSVGAAWKWPTHTDLSPPWMVFPVRTLKLYSSICAGHNKWSKVKHIKGPKDDARSRMFMKFNMMIRIAVKDGGSNPEFNAALANLVDQCRAKNMPKSSIDAAIKGAEKAKAGTQQTYEARGPGGCMMLIEVLTDNFTRSHQEVKRLLNKNGGVLADGARHKFNRKGVVVVQGQHVTAERALELAIEAGAEDVRVAEDEEEQPLLQFICDMTELKNVRTSLEELGLQIASAGLEFVAHTPATLDQAQLEAASTLIEALNDYTDVVRVWDNIQAQS